MLLLNNNISVIIMFYINVLIINCPLLFSYQCHCCRDYFHHHVRYLIHHLTQNCHNFPHQPHNCTSLCIVTYVFYMYIVMNNDLRYRYIYKHQIVHLELPVVCIQLAYMLHLFLTTLEL